MQQNNSKHLHISQKFGLVVRNQRLKNDKMSMNTLANSYGISKGNLSKIENGQECKFVTAWKIAEALGMKLSDFVKLLEDELGDDFKLIDE